MPSSDLAVAPPVGTYRIEPADSAIAIHAKHLFGLATVHGRVPVVDGELVVADEPASSHVIVTASAAGFDSGDARRDRAVAAKKFLHVEQHPTMRFASFAVSDEAGHWVVDGVLTAHGVEAPLRLTVTDVQTDADGVSITAAGRADRYAHGITAMRGMAGRWIDLQITARAVRATTDRPERQSTIEG